MRIHRPQALCFEILTCLILVMFSGCQSPTEVYLNDTSKLLNRLGETWSAMGDFPASSTCLKIEQELESIENNIQQLSPPTSCLKLQGHLINLVALQKNELVLNQDLNTLGDSVRAGKRTQDDIREEGRAILAKSAQNAVTLVELTKQIGAEVSAVRNHPQRHSGQP
jgi:hypothetical protein